MGAVGEMFNWVQMICIPKGSTDHEHNEVIRSPDCTRPLTLSNGSSKLLSTATNEPLAYIAQ
eukprot:4918164-Pyramimonas_sp.AAC.1